MADVQNEIAAAEKAAVPAPVADKRVPTKSLADYVSQPDPLSAEAQRFVVTYTAETDLLDFKKDFDLSEREWIELTKDVVSFANTKGGYLVFGVEDGTRKVLGMEIAHAVPISDPSTVQAKVNRFIEPKLTTVSCTRSQVDGTTDRFLVFVHVPPTKNATHIVVNNGTFKDSAGKDKTSLRVGEIYIHRVGSRSVVAPQDFEQLLERRMTDFKQELFRRIALVGQATIESKVVVIEKGQAGYDAATPYRLSSDASAKPMAGVSPTATPTNDEEELATFVAAFRKDRNHRPAEAMLYRLYARRHEAKVAPEYVCPIIELSVLMAVPAVFWVRRADKNAVVELLGDASRFETAQQRHEALALLSLVDAKHAMRIAPKVLEKDTFSLNKFMSTVRDGRQLELFGAHFLDAEKKRTGLDGEALTQEIEKRATTSALAIAEGRAGRTDSWWLREFDAWLYGRAHDMTA